MKGLSPNQVQALVDWLASLRDEAVQGAEKCLKAGQHDFAEYWTERAHSADFAEQEDSA